MDVATLSLYAFALRVFERIAISLVVIAVALVVTVGFWRSIQKIDFDVSHDKLASGTRMILSTPVLVLLALIGFAWVSFSNPVSVSLPSPSAAADEQVPNIVTLTGSVPGNTQSADDVATRRARTLQTIRNLNCIAAKAGLDSLTAAQEDAFALARLGLMEQVWGPDWGPVEVFRQTTMGISSEIPNSDAQKFFSELAQPC